MALMDPIKLVVVAVALYLCVSQYEVIGGISQGEGLEFERQLKSLNKHPIKKTIQTEVGDTVDCIDIHKQPAFDHPLLKNHKIQMKPISRVQGLIDGSGTSSSGDKHSKFTRRSIDCPQGTVPIRRTRQEDLIRAKSFSNTYATNIHPHSTYFSAQQLAILRTIKDTNKTYSGVSGYINLQNPKVGEDQGSSAQMWVENGASTQLNGLQAGWMVAPPLFGDDKTRSFIFWTANGGTGCYNFLCSGFVQVHKDHLIGDIMGPISEYNGKQYDIEMTIFQDVGTGHWWLTFEETIHVGYWPKELLPNLMRGASLVAWGGLARGSSYGHMPPMGSGHFPDNNFQHSCWFKKIQVVNTSNYLDNPEEKRLETILDKRDCYDLTYDGYLSKTLGHAFFFGGLGGDC